MIYLLIYCAFVSVFAVAQSLRLRRAKAECMEWQTAALRAVKALNDGKNKIEKADQICRHAQSSAGRVR